MSRHKFTGTLGLPLTRRAIRILKEGGIYAHSLLSVEHQELAKRYVIRGLESGGSVGDVGRYVMGRMNCIKARPRVNCGLRAAR